MYNDVWHSRAVGVRLKNLALITSWHITYLIRVVRLHNQKLIERKQKPLCEIFLFNNLNTVLVIIWPWHSAHCTHSYAEHTKYIKLSKNQLGVHSVASFEFR